MTKVAAFSSLQNGKKLIFLKHLRFQIKNFCIPVRYSCTVRSVNEHKKAQEKQKITSSGERITLGKGELLQRILHSRLLSMGSNATSLEDQLLSELLKELITD